MFFLVFDAGMTRSLPNFIERLTRFNWYPVICIYTNKEPFQLRNKLPSFSLELVAPHTQRASSAETYQQVEPQLSDNRHLLKPSNHGQV